ncbi:gamma-tubulin complex, DGRIP91/SPC98 component [Pholiota conissans]|uniref:Gamma-tubulin complex, DGRIP91/SPC98 component n=1 Tax=Pholiota conissans TaxID=109636 RepID=A0A9P5ZD87_9AGAR|nr:gamma-tubulin complex, DGRIP91/SPC98 component [Pholiota conissans]
MSSPFLDSLVHTYVHASRTNESLKNDLIAHCEDILARKKEAIIFLSILSSYNSQPQPAIPLSFISQPLPTTSQGNVTATTPPLRMGEQDRSCAARLQYMPESLLVRDTLYLMQGISGKYVKFAPSKEDAKKLVFTSDIKHVITASTQVSIHRLAELGYLYSRVESFVRERETATGVGMIEQSLCHYLQKQLTEYYRLIAVLETQLSLSSSNVVSDSSQPWAEETGLSLRRLDVWVNDWRLRMRMMSVCVEGARDSNGGALVNLIHSYTDNGDPFVRKFTDELLEEVSRPFFATLHKWLFSGELYDPFEEFFVTADSSLGHVAYVHPSSIPGGINHLSNDDGFGGDNDEILGRDNGQKLWETKYRFRKDMLPMFVGESFGKKIFSTGKSLNFIRYSCLDSDWVVTREKMSNTGGILQYGDIGGLERSIDTAYQVASHRLFEVLIDKFKLLDHLSALKSFLLLGHGDFADQLMDTLGPSLGKPANTLHRHNLTVDLETAIRSSNAQKDPTGVLRRLDARMLEYSHGEIGWDVFTLEYKVTPPIDTVLDQEAMGNYLKLFKHLWQMKRMEKALDTGWMRVTGGSQTFVRLHAILPDVDYEWHRIRLVIAEMIHFIRQLEAFCRLEVIECSWKILVEFLNKKEGDLDALIDAHRTYLDRVTKKILLWNPKPGKEELLLRLLTEIFSTILQYREATENFYNYCLTESARRDQEMDEERGVYTGNATQAAARTNEVPARLLDRVNEYGLHFSEKVQLIVQQLQIHPDLDCRFLGVRLSFSDYYKSKKDAQSGQGSKA